MIVEYFFTRNIEDLCNCNCVVGVEVIKNMSVVKCRLLTTVKLRVVLCMVISNEIKLLQQHKQLISVFLF